jgi:membrane protein implicated in regulation of membrane protease activity
MGYGWILLALGLAGLIEEVFVAGHVMLWPTLSVLIATIPAWQGASPVAVLLTLLVSMLILAFLARGISRNVGKRRITIPRQRAAAVIGKLGCVKQSIRGRRRPGIVSVDREIWTARSATGKALVEGEIVEVASIDGATLVVVPF